MKNLYLTRDFMQPTTIIKRALLSVSDKTGLVEFARRLCALDIEIISSGGTAKTLRDADLPVTDVADVTQFPEMMDGRVKTLHPKIHGGILGLRDKHAQVAREHQIDWIDLVVVNLYPFAQTIKKSSVTLDDAIENIDIGGPSMIRSAAKNMAWVGVIVDPTDYGTVISELEANKNLSAATRRELAAKAFGHTAEYDRVIHHYLQNENSTVPATDKLILELDKFADLRYGENPHQTASAYIIKNAPSGILSAKQLQGKQLSYNNIADADAAVACLQEYSQPACVVVKHANPCGVAVADEPGKAFTRAFNADAQSAFGGIIALNRACDKKIAEEIWQVFVEVIIAPSFSPEALSIFATKPNLRVLEYSSGKEASTEYKFIRGGLLLQDRDSEPLDPDKLEVVTAAKPNSIDLASMLFAWRTLKHIKSNAILLATESATVGIGAGQVSRIDAVEIALRKAGKNVAGAILASDAFFPFRDSIDRIAGTGIRAVIQPGGSLKDKEVISACDEHGIAMIFTGKRCFKH
jgi:phosphoribosylaminoimidazolecarboxamide formyltransferase/IMP cyclohydrolase